MDATAGAPAGVPTWRCSLMATRPLRHPEIDSVRVADILHALADPVRLAIVCELMEAEVGHELRGDDEPGAHRAAQVNVFAALPDPPRGRADPVRAQGGRAVEPAPLPRARRPVPRAAQVDLAVVREGEGGRRKAEGRFRESGFLSGGPVTDEGRRRLRPRTASAPTRRPPGVPGGRSRGWAAAGEPSNSRR